MTFIRSLFRSIILFVLGLLCLSTCKKDGPPAPSFIRLEDLLQDAKTEIDSHFNVAPADFKQYAGEGWTHGNSSVQASDKRAIFLLPEWLWQSRDFRMKFSARSQTPRKLTVLAQGQPMASYELTSDWKEYSLRFTTRDLKKKTLKQLQFAFEGAPGSPYAEFQNFRMPLYSFGRVKLQQELRTALSIHSSAKARFQLRLPESRPTLFFGVGAPVRAGHESEVTYKVSITSGKKTETLLSKVLKFKPPQLRWTDEKVDLEKYAGEEVTLELQTQAPKNGTQHYVAWSSPEIYDIEAKQETPNIILMSIDTLRADRVSEKIAPNLTRFAKESLWYQNAYCTFPSTLASHTSVMTGLYPGHHQVSRPVQEILRVKQIPQKLTTIAELAHDAKYYTAGITDGGFVAAFFGFDQGFQQYSDNLHEGRQDVATIRNAITWLNQNSKRPFFLFLHSYEVHEPFYPNAEVFKKLFPSPALDRDPRITMEYLHKIVDGEVIPTEQEKEFIRQCYDAEVHFFDQSFDKLLQELKRLELDRNTVVLIFSDHGEQFFDRDSTFGHGKTLEKEEIQVPIILHIPGQAAAVRKDLASLVDIFPTVAQILKKRPEIPLDGISLLEPPDSQKRLNRPVFFEVLYANEAKWGAQTREFKLILDKQQSKEYFYDLRKDPDQKNNLSNTDHRSLAQMKKMLAEYVQKSTSPTDWAKTAQEKEETGDLREQLKALGYIN